MVSFGVALTNVVAQNYGAKKYDRVKKSIPAGLLVSSLMSIVLSSTVLILVHPLVLMFTSEPEVIEQAVSILRFLVPMLIAYAAVETFFALINGLGKSIYSTIVTIFGVVVVRIAWVTLYASKTYNVRTILFAFPCWIITTLLYLVIYIL